MPFILQTSGLSKKIGSKALVTDVNIHIPKGEIYGLKCYTNVVTVVANKI